MKRFFHATAYGLLLGITTWQLAAANDSKSDSATMRTQAQQDEIVVRAIERMPNVDLKKYPAAQDAVARHIRRQIGQPEFMDLIRRFRPVGMDDALLATVLSPDDDSSALKALQFLLGRGNSAEAFGGYLREMPVSDAARIARLLGVVANEKSLALLRDCVTNPDIVYDVRSAAVRALASSNTGSAAVLALASSDELPADLHLLAGGLLARSEDATLVAKAAELLPLPTASDQAPLPPLDELVQMTGDVAHGAELFRGVATCGNCHLVHGQGKSVGPDLSEIGTKLSRESMYMAILAPSAGISHNYENYIALLESGRIVNGLLMTQDDDKVVLRSAEAIDIEIDAEEILEMKKSEKSIMPENLHLTTDQQGLVDLVEYLMTLKKTT